MRPEETTYQSALDKPLDQLTDEDISQLTREDCRRYLKEKGMRRPSWNKSQAIQQVLSLKSLLETRSDSGAGTRQSFVSSRPENPLPHHIPSGPVSASDEHVSYRRKDPPKLPFSGNVSARLPSTDNNKSIPPTPNRIKSVASEPVGQMTIFYHGKVNVYDDVSATKARAIMQLAASPIYLPLDTPSGVNTAIRPFPCHLQASSDTPGSSSPASSSPSLQTTKVAVNTVPYKEEGSMSHEVEPGPASRKASLQRYLEKRKDRYSLKG
ncbi:protein TIFY 4B-like isoform X2 [Macadamia integrifolia]|uniref:protein TIFY 4B-like isoform X2 n=1 Tax=Macadamia integrifolia TaxID=60698 RepID=UPI001C4FFE9A|nr:protein TIFY 4B-like isoform X2 [Macadamia integrifolia]